MTDVRGTGIAPGFGRTAAVVIGYALAKAYLEAAAATGATSPRR